MLAAPMLGLAGCFWRSAETGGPMEPQLQPPTLAAPDTNGVVRWEAVSGNVAGFQILVNDVSMGMLLSTVRSFDVSGFAVGNYALTVRAMAGTGYRDSEPSTAIEFAVTQLQPPTNVRTAEGMLVWDDAQNPARNGHQVFANNVLIWSGTAGTVEVAELRERLLLPGTYRITVRSVAGAWNARHSNQSESHTDINIH